MNMEGLRFKCWILVNDGEFDMILNYSKVDFDLNDSGGKGGEFIEPWEAREE